MAVDKILKGMLDENFRGTPFVDIADSKKYEYLVNKLVITKYAPEAFSDVGDIENVDVDDGDLFGIDAIAFVINGNLVFSKDDIEKYAISKRLDVEVIFIQTKTESDVNSGSVLKFSEAVKFFCDDIDKLKGTKNEAIKNAKEIYDSLFSFEHYKLCTMDSPRFALYYVYAGTKLDEKLINNICEKEENTICSELQNIKSVSFHIFGRDEIINAYQESLNTVSERIYLKDCISLDKINGVKSAYIGCLSGNEYLKLITDNNGLLRRQIFYENVRDYQGYNNVVNSEIRKTIQNSEESKQFVLLNNGVTVISKDILSLGSNYYEINNFQIVNGCQTSNEIYNERSKADSLMIPVKFIATEDPDFISRVIRSTNRQSPVPDEAFIALDKYHKQLQILFEQYSKEMPIKIFYERRMGEGNDIRQKDESFSIVKLHGVIRNVTSVYFKEAYVVHNNNPANILKNRKDKLFCEEHPLEIYYIASYLFEEFLDLERKKVLASNDYVFRNYIIMVVRILLSKSVKVPDFESKEMKNECALLIEELKKDCSKTFFDARNIVIETSKLNEYKLLSCRQLVLKPDFCKAVINKTEEFITKPNNNAIQIEKTRKIIVKPKLS